MPSSLPTLDPEIDVFLAAFENGSLPKSEWTHAAHLLAGACYVHRLGEDAALDHMRLCVSRYNLAVGGQNTATGGYHATITGFWIKVIAATRKRMPEISRSSFAAYVVGRFSNQRDLFKRYYDFDLVGSVEARAAWVAPTTLSIHELVDNNGGA